MRVFSSKKKKELGSHFTDEWAPPCCSGIRGQLVLITCWKTQHFRALHHSAVTVSEGSTPKTGGNPTEVPTNSSQGQIEQERDQRVAEIQLRLKTLKPQEKPTQTLMNWVIEGCCWEQLIKLYRKVVDPPVPTALAQIYTFSEVKNLWKTRWFAVITFFFTQLYRCIRVCSYVWLYVSNTINVHKRVVLRCILPGRNKKKSLSHSLKCLSSNNRTNCNWKLCSNERKGQKKKKRKLNSTRIVQSK